MDIFYKSVKNLLIINSYKWKIGDCESQKWDATARKYSNEAALSLRSRRSGTKRTALLGCLLSADVFQGASYGILPCLR